MLERVKFFLRAVNRHGVHSPFVFDILEKGLRSRRRASLIARLQAYFGENMIRIVEAEELSSLSDKEFPPDTIIYIQDIHRSTALFQQWTIAIQQPAVQLSIEFWEGGLLFFRKDFLVKQHFTLRYKR